MTLRAGIGTAIITPALPVYLAGYGDRREPANAVHDDLEARVLVLEESGTRCCLVTCDLLAMSRDFSDPVRAAVADIAETDVEHVLTSCTHTHAGPSTLTGTDAIGWPVPAGYRELLVARAGEAARLAMDTRTPVAASWSSGQFAGDVAVNRRGYDLAPRVETLVLDPLAVLVNFGIHPTVSGPTNHTVATDWVGPFRRAVEARTQYRTVFLQGCQGDVNPSITSWEQGDPRTWSAAVDGYADRLATEVSGLIAHAAPIACSPVGVRRRDIRVPVGDTLLAQLAGGRPERAIELLDWRLGDVRLVAVPGEGFHGLQHTITEPGQDAFLLAGLAPDWHGYFPVPYAEGYEEGLSFGPDAVRRIVDALTR
jgi:neutral ceramidase